MHLSEARSAQDFEDALTLFQLYADSLDFPLDFQNCQDELERLPDFRGRGVGRMLAERIVDLGRSAGYETMRLDTLMQMREVNSLYESLGFRRIGAYRHNPLPGACFFELAL